MKTDDKILKIILGTAQLGLNYGPHQNEYEVSSERACEILEKAYDLGVRDLDTAIGYGKSHSFIGEFHRLKPNKVFSIYTKITSEDFKKDPQVIDQILTELNIQSLDGVLLHRPVDALDESLRKYLASEKAKGKIKKIGLSLYYDEDFFSLVDNFKPDLVQVPFNVLDNTSLRFKEFSFLKDQKIEIHGRSCFLRGALVSNDFSSVPSDLIPWIKQISTLSSNAHIPLDELCLNYAVQTEQVEKIIIGIDSVNQLKENLGLLKNNISQKVIDDISKVVMSDPKLLDLRKW